MFDHNVSRQHDDNVHEDGVGERGRASEAVHDGVRPGRMWVPRTRGAVGGILLILLGLWGALIPFVGPYFSFSFVPDQAWTWTAGRGWLEVLPGAVTVVGGILLVFSANRAVASFGAWLAVAGGVVHRGSDTGARAAPRGSGGALVNRTCKQSCAAVDFLRGPGRRGLVPGSDGSWTTLVAQSSRRITRSATNRA